MTELTETSSCCHGTHSSAREAEEEKEGPEKAIGRCEKHWGRGLKEGPPGLRDERRSLGGGCLLNSQQVFIEQLLRAREHQRTEPRKQLALPELDSYWGRRQQNEHGWVYSVSNGNTW